ncbi:hypothetical protein EJB05_01136, partial [Eragrostis curvula]
MGGSPAALQGLLCSRRASSMKLCNLVPEGGGDLGGGDRGEGEGGALLLLFPLMLRIPRCLMRRAKLPSEELDPADESPAELFSHSSSMAGPGSEPCATTWAQDGAAEEDAPTALAGPEGEGAACVGREEAGDLAERPWEGEPGARQLWRRRGVVAAAEESRGRALWTIHSFIHEASYEAACEATREAAGEVVLPNDFRHSHSQSCFPEKSQPQPEPKQTGPNCYRRTEAV